MVTYIDNLDHLLQESFVGSLDAPHALLLLLGHGSRVGRRAASFSNFRLVVSHLHGKAVFVERVECHELAAPFTIVVVNYLDVV